MYNLKSESRASKFYEWLWNTDVTKYKTMCPYFWMYVLTILILPVILLCKFIYHIMPAKEKVEVAMDKFAESKAADAIVITVETIAKPKRFWFYVGQTIKWAFFIAVGAMLLLVLLAMIFGFIQNPVGGLAVIGCIALLIVVLMGIGALDSEFDLRKQIAKPFKFLGNMIYSLYKNVCPIIKWN